MESHEEKLHKMIIQSKINDTKDVMKRKAIEIDKQKLDREARARESKVPAYVPSVSSVSVGGRSPMHNDDSTPTYSKYAQFLCFEVPGTEYALRLSLQLPQVCLLLSDARRYN
jgi:hypothetical protein